MMQAQSLDGGTTSIVQCPTTSLSLPLRTLGLRAMWPRSFSMPWTRALSQYTLAPPMWRTLCHHIRSSMGISLVPWRSWQNTWLPLLMIPLPMPSTMHGGGAGWWPIMERPGPQALTPCHADCVRLLAERVEETQNLICEGEESFLLLLVLGLLSCVSYYSWDCDVHRQDFAFVC